MRTVLEITSMLKKGDLISVKQGKQWNYACAEAVIERIEENPRKIFYREAGTDRGTNYCDESDCTLIPNKIGTGTTSTGSLNAVSSMGIIGELAAYRYGSNGAGAMMEYHSSSGGFYPGGGSGGGWSPYFVPNVHLGEVKLTTTKPKPMATLKEKASMLFKGEPEKSFIRAGIMDSRENLTSEGTEVFLNWLLKTNGEAFKKEVVDPIIAEDIAAKKA